MGNAGEFELSQEVLAVLPADPYEQLDMARRITALAVATRVTKLEAATGKLRQKLAEKDHVITGLQKRMAEAQTTLQETNAKLLLSMDEQVKLVSEKNTLSNQVKKLFRDVAKLETFKRTLMQSLQEEDDRPNNDGGLPPNLAVWKASQQAELTVTRAQIIEDDGQYASVGAKSPSSNDDLIIIKSVTVPKPQSGRTTPKIHSTRSSARGTPSLTPRRTPTGSPKPMSLDSHQQIQIPTSLPTSRSGSRSSSPSRASGQSRSSRLDGKEFFRQARSRLSYEQFSSFLAYVKELNARRQTREETLSKAEELFGPENQDLYTTFEGILSRHLP